MRCQRGPSSCMVFLSSLETAKPEPLHPKLDGLASAGLLSLVFLPLCHVSLLLGDGISKELDIFLKCVEGLQTFDCGGNSWVEPPAAVLNKARAGIVSAIRSYFVYLYREKRVISRSLKVVLVGREGTGKTR